MNSTPAVYVPVVSVEAGRQIGWGSNAIDQLDRHRVSIQAAVLEGARTVAQSLSTLTPPESWQLKEVQATFGIILTAEAGVILSKASAETTFEVSVTFARQDAAE